MRRVSGAGEARSADPCQGGPVGRDSDEKRSVPAVEENRDPLSPRDRLILEELSNPDNDRRDLKEIAQRSGVTPRILQRVRNKELFAQELQALLLRRIQRHLPGVIESLARSAVIDGREGHPDRKLYLAMAGMVPSTAGGRSPRDAAAADAAAVAALGARWERALAQAEEMERNPPQAPVIDQKGEEFEASE